MTYYGGGYSQGQDVYTGVPSPVAPQSYSHGPPISYYHTQYQMYQQPSQHYGSYGNYYTNNVFQVHAWEVSAELSPHIQIQSSDVYYYCFLSCLHLAS